MGQPGPSTPPYLMARFRRCQSFVRMAFGELGATHHRPVRLSPSKWPEPRIGDDKARDARQRRGAGRPTN